ncbi:hypothetical protein TNCV_4642851 [Trichonephila clavipes]|nr:hypothetical protein TNCV_4642851 [Trichonephila clavipes]
MLIVTEGRTTHFLEDLPLSDLRKVWVLHDVQDITCDTVHLRHIPGKSHWGFSLKIGAEPSQIVLPPAWCSNLRLTTGVKNLALSRDEFRGPRSDVAVDQMA